MTAVFKGVTLEATDRTEKMKEFISKLVPCPRCGGDGETSYRGEGGYDYGENCWMCHDIHMPFIFEFSLPREMAIFRGKTTPARAALWERCQKDSTPNGGKHQDLAAWEELDELQGQNA